MKIKKILLKNIRSYKEQEIEFPHGSILLSGDIGSGKTSILLGIEFALFGLQPGQRGSSLLRNGETDGEVIMEFEADGKNVVIERTLKKAKTISQGQCSITIDEERRELSVTELKNRVLEILNYPQEFSKKQNILYKFTVYTPQEEMKQIILQDAETRTNTLRHVFGIDKYKKILENISIVTLKIREEKRMKEGLTMNLEQDKSDLITKENEIESKEHNLSSVERELFLKIERRKKIQEEKEELSKKIEERNKLEQEIEKTRLMILNKKETIFANSKTIKQLKEQIEEARKFKFDEQKFKQTENELSSFKKEKEKLDVENLRINSEIGSFNLKTEDNKKVEKKISSLDICPTCLQNVDSVYRANVLNRIDSDNVDIKKRIEELEKEKKKTIEILDKINKEISLRQEKIQELKILKIKLQETQEKEKRLSDLEKSNEFFEKDVKLLEQHVFSLKSIVLELGKFSNLFELKQKELDNALEEERMVQIKIAELKKEIELFLNQVKILKEKIKKTEEIKNQLNYLMELEDWISKQFILLISLIERNVMIRLKSEFSKLFAEWFLMLVSDSFIARLSDDFTPIIEQQDYEIDYEYLSGGERTAVALAYRLALNQVINSMLSKIKTKDLVILDEPTDGFSEQQLDKMRDVLQQLNVSQLIIVSHEQKIESFVENVIRFKKEGGVSKIDRLEFEF